MITREGRIFHIDAEESERSWLAEAPAEVEVSRTGELINSLALQAVWRQIRGNRLLAEGSHVEAFQNFDTALSQLETAHNILAQMTSDERNAFVTNSLALEMIAEHVAPLDEVA